MYFLVEIMPQSHLQSRQRLPHPDHDEELPRRQRHLRQPRGHHHPAHHNGVEADTNIIHGKGKEPRRIYIEMLKHLSSTATFSSKYCYFVRTKSYIFVMYVCSSILHHTEQLQPSSFHALYPIGLCLSTGLRALSGNTPGFKNVSRVILFSMQRCNTRYNKATLCIHCILAPVPLLVNPSLSGCLSSQRQI